MSTLHRTAKNLYNTPYIHASAKTEKTTEIKILYTFFRTVKIYTMHPIFMLAQKQK